MNPEKSINQSISHLFVKASKMPVTKVSVQDQQGSESAYSDPVKKKKERLQWEGFAEKELAWNERVSG